MKLTQICLLLMGAFISQSRLHGETLLDYHFKGQNQSSEEALLSNPLWSYSKNGILKVVNMKPECWLQMGGKATGVHQLQIGFGKPVRSGVLKIVTGTSATATKTEIRLMSGTKKILSYILLSPTILELEADRKLVYNKKQFPEMNMAVFGGEIPLRGGQKYRLEAEIDWSEGVAGPVKVHFTQPDLNDSPKIEVTENVVFMDPSEPDRIEIENGRVDQDSAWVAVYSLKLESK